jgi:hypothetical protein
MNTVRSGDGGLGAMGSGVVANARSLRLLEFA